MDVKIRILSHRKRDNTYEVNVYTDLLEQQQIPVWEARAAELLRAGLVQTLEAGLERAKQIDFPGWKGTITVFDDTLEGEALLAHFIMRSVGRGDFLQHLERKQAELPEPKCPVDGLARACSISVVAATGQLDISVDASPVAEAL